MSNVLNSRQMCELILSSSDATPTEKRIAKIRLDELDAGDESQVYIRLDSVDAPADRAAIVAAIQLLDPAFEDSASISLSYLQGRLDQMQSSRAVKGTAVTGSPVQPVAKLDAHEGFMDGMVRMTANARYEQRRQSAIAYCRGDAAAEAAAVARLDASIAHEIELEKYRADRAEQTKLDASGGDVSPVVKAQIAYHAKVRSLHRGNGSNDPEAA